MKTFYLLSFFLLLAGTASAAQLIAVPQGGSSSGYGLNNATTPAGNWWVGGNTFNYTGGTGTYNVTSLTVRTFRGSTSATTNTSAIISYTNSTNGCTGFNTTSQMIATGYTGNYNLNTTHGNHTITLTTPATLNDSQSYCLMFGGDSGELGRLELQTTSTVGQWHYAGGSPPLIPYLSYNVVFALYGEVNSASSPMFSITAKNNDTLSALTNFSANVTYGGLTINYNTTNGTIYTNITSDTGTTNITVYANNYFSNTTTNFNTSANLEMPLVPYSVVLASDRYNHSSILSFNAQYAGVNYSSNSTTGLAYVPATTTPYSLAVTSSNYIPFTFDNATRTATYNASIFQAQVTFNASELTTGNAVTDFTVTSPLQNNTDTNPVLYLAAGDYNFTFAKSSYYNFTKQVTVNALDNVTETFDEVYSYILNITVADANNGTYLNNFSALLYSSTTGNLSTYTTTNGSIIVPWANETSLLNITIFNIIFNNVTYANTSSYIVFNGTAPAYENKTVSVYLQNTVDFNLLDSYTLTLLNVSANITLTGSTATYNFNTSNGTYHAASLNADTYTVRVTATGYNANTVLLTTAGDYQNVTYYMDGNTQLVTFSLQDTLGNPIENSTVSFGRNFNGTIQTFAQIVTDFSGLFSLYLNPSVTYLLTATHPSGTYATFTGNILPSQSTTYLIRMQFANAETFSSILNYTYAHYTAVYDNTTSTINVSYEVISSIGDLDNFGLSTDYNTTNFAQNVTGITGGGIATILITGVDLTFQNTINVTFFIDRTGFSVLNYSVPFTFEHYATSNQSLTGGLSNNFPTSWFGKALLGTFILVVCIAGIFALTSSSTAAIVTGIVVTGVLSIPTVALFPLLYGVIVVVVGIVVLIADEVTTK